MIERILISKQHLESLNRRIEFLEIQNKELLESLTFRLAAEPIRIICCEICGKEFVNSVNHTKT